MSNVFSEIKVDTLLLNENSKIYENNGKIIYDNGNINILSTSGFFVINFNTDSSSKNVSMDKNVNYKLITSENSENNNNVYISNDGVNINHHQYKVFGSITFKSIIGCDVLISFLDTTSDKDCKISSICGKTVKKDELVTLQTTGVTGSNCHLINMIIRCSNNTELEIIDWGLVMTRL